MEWISTKDKPFPRDQETYFVIWKGAPGIASYDEEYDAIYLGIFPSEYEVLKLSKEREVKITHWMKPEIP
jgi:hypothetical protein